MSEASPIFNNREVASGIWLLVVVIFLLARTETRSIFGHLIKVVASKYIVLLAISFGLNILSICWALSKLSIWQSDQISATVLWALLSVIPLIMTAVKAQEKDHHFQGLFWSSIGVSAVFEFIIVAQPFSLLGEMILFPIIFFFSAMIAAFEKKEQHALPRKFFELMLVAIVIIITWNSLNYIWDSPAKFFNGKTVRNFVLPIFLTIGSIPFLYCWYSYSHIQLARNNIDQKNFQSEDLKRYARRRFFLIFPLRPWLLHRAVNRFQSMPAETKADVNRIVDEIYQYERDIENPPPVDSKKGWSPFLACEFLVSEGLRSTSPRSSFESEWWASSNTVDLDKALIPNTVTFYLSGGSGVANSLKLKGFFLDEYKTDYGMEKFSLLSLKLLETATESELSDDDLNSVFNSMMSLEEGKYSTSSTDVIWEIKRFANDNGFNFVFQVLRQGADQSA